VFVGLGLTVRLSNLDTRDWLLALALAVVVRPLTVGVTLSWLRAHTGHHIGSGSNSVRTGRPVSRLTRPNKCPVKGGWILAVVATVEIGRCGRRGWCRRGSPCIAAPSRSN
jgi:hypothetical protein